jgi:hypothetical protein
VEHFREQHGDKPLALLQREHMHNLLAKIDRPSAKRNWLKVIRALMSFAVSIDMRADDPTEGIKLAAVKSDGFQSGVRGILLPSADTIRSVPARGLHLNCSLAQFSGAAT